MKNFVTAEDVMIQNFPKRNDIAVWIDVSANGSAFPAYKCSECGEYSVLAPRAYCCGCGALMVNYNAVSDAYYTAVKEYRAKEDKENDVP